MKKIMLILVLLLISISVVALELSSSTIIGTKTIKELCNPIYDTWIEEIPHYTLCITDNCKLQDINNISKCIEIKYECFDYTEYVLHKHEEINCIPNGKVNVSGIIYEKEDSYCKIRNDSICCYDNKDGGKYAIDWREDNSINIGCQDLKTDIIEIKGEDTFIRSITDMLSTSKELLTIK